MMYNLNNVHKFYDFLSLVYSIHEEKLIEWNDFIKIFMKLSDEAKIGNTWNSLEHFVKTIQLGINGKEFFNRLKYSNVKDLVRELHKRGIVYVIGKKRITNQEEREFSFTLISEISDLWSQKLDIKNSPHSIVFYDSITGFRPLLDVENELDFIEANCYEFKPSGGGLFKNPLLEIMDTNNIDVFQTIDSVREKYYNGEVKVLSLAENELDKYHSLRKRYEENYNSMKGIRHSISMVVRALGVYWNLALNRDYNGFFNWNAIDLTHWWLRSNEFWENPGHAVQMAQELCRNCHNEINDLKWKVDILTMEELKKTVHQPEEVESTEGNHSLDANSIKLVIPYYIDSEENGTPNEPDVILDSSSPAKNPQTDKFESLPKIRILEPFLLIPSFKVYHEGKKKIKFPAFRLYVNSLSMIIMDNQDSGTLDRYQDYGEEMRFYAMVPNEKEIYNSSYSVFHNFINFLHIHDFSSLSDRSSYLYRVIERELMINCVAIPNGSKEDKLVEEWFSSCFSCLAQFACYIEIIQPPIIQFLIMDSLLNGFFRLVLMHGLYKERLMNGLLELDITEFQEDIIFLSSPEWKSTDLCLTVSQWNQIKNKYCDLMKSHSIDRTSIGEVMLNETLEYVDKDFFFPLITSGYGSDNQGDAIKKLSVFWHLLLEVVNSRINVLLDKEDLRVILMDTVSLSATEYHDLEESIQRDYRDIMIFTFSLNTLLDESKIYLINCHSFEASSRTFIWEVKDLSYNHVYGFSRSFLTDNLQKYLSDSDFIVLVTSSTSNCPDKDKTSSISENILNSSSKIGYRLEYTSVYGQFDKFISGIETFINNPALQTIDQIELALKELGDIRKNLTASPPKNEMKVDVNIYYKLFELTGRITTYLELKKAELNSEFKPSPLNISILPLISGLYSDDGAVMKKLNDVEIWLRNWEKSQSIKLEFNVNRISYPYGLDFNDEKQKMQNKKFNMVDDENPAIVDFILKKIDNEIAKPGPTESTTDIEEEELPITTTTTTSTGRKRPKKKSPEIKTEEGDETRPTQLLSTEDRSKLNYLEALFFGLQNEQRNKNEEYNQLRKEQERTNKEFEKFKIKQLKQEEGAKFPVTVIDQNGNQVPQLMTLEQLKNTIEREKALDNWNNLQESKLAENQVRNVPYVDNGVSENRQYTLKNMKSLLDTEKIISDWYKFQEAKAHIIENKYPVEVINADNTKTPALLTLKEMKEKMESEKVISAWNEAQKSKTTPPPSVPKYPVQTIKKVKNNDMETDEVGSEELTLDELKTRIDVEKTLQNWKDLQEKKQGKPKEDEYEVEVIDDKGVKSKEKHTLGQLKSLMEAEKMLQNWKDFQQSKLKSISSPEVPVENKYNVKYINADGKEESKELTVKDMKAIMDEEKAILNWNSFQKEKIPAPPPEAKKKYKVRSIKKVSKDDMEIDEIEEEDLTLEEIKKKMEEEKILRSWDEFHKPKPASPEERTIKLAQFNENGEELPPKVMNLREIKEELEWERTLDAWKEFQKKRIEVPKEKPKIYDIQVRKKQANDMDTDEPQFETEKLTLEELKKKIEEEKTLAAWEDLLSKTGPKSDDDYSKKKYKIQVTDPNTGKTESTDLTLDEIKKKIEEEKVLKNWNDLLASKSKPGEEKEKEKLTVTIDALNEKGIMGKETLTLEDLKAKLEKEKALKSWNDFQSSKNKPEEKEKEKPTVTITYTNDTGTEVTESVTLDKLKNMIDSRKALRSWNELNDKEYSSSSSSVSGKDSSGGKSLRSGSSRKPTSKTRPVLSLIPKISSDKYL